MLGFKKIDSVDQKQFGDAELTLVVQKLKERQELKNEGRDDSAHGALLSSRMKR